MKNRLLKLREHLSENMGILVSNPVNAYYLTGIKSSNITLYITLEKAFLLTDFRYKEIAEKNSLGFSVISENKISDNLKEIIKEEKVLIESNYITYDFYLKLKTDFLKTDFLTADQIIEKLRLIKDETEISLIKKACEISDKAYLETLKNIKEGITEIELKAILNYNMKLAPSFDTIVLFSENSSRPHGVPSERKLKYGDNILMDFGVFYNEYASDMTRTVFFGNVSSEQKKSYDYVLNAHNKAVDIIFSTQNCAEIDKTARDYLENSDYKGLFGHSLGHGVGLFIHENPRLSTNSTDILQENMVFTIEPGIYIERNFGIRIENTYYYHKNSAISLNNVEKGLTIL